MIASIRRNMTWRAVPIAGLAAGTAFLLVTFIAMPLYGAPSGLMLRYAAALVLGAGALTAEAAGPTVWAVGLVVHYALALAFALLVAVVVHRWGLLVGIVIGAVLGASLYAINLYAMTRFFEWFFAINSPALLIAHVIYGAVAGGVYELFDHYDEPFFGQTEAKS